MKINLTILNKKLSITKKKKPLHNQYSHLNNQVPEISIFHSSFDNAGHKM